jgi:class 3 adenylate cyclase
MRILRSILPDSIIRRMQAGENIISDMHEFVVVLFSDIVGFTSMASDMSVPDVFKLLSMMFVSFDKLVDKHCVFKVETIGDAYMVVAGHDEDLRKRAAGHPLMRVLAIAVDMLDVVQHMRAPDGRCLHIRIGVHCGPAASGVIGLKSPRYCFIGDTINTASRMQTSGFPMCVHVSDAVVSNALQCCSVDHERRHDHEQLHASRHHHRQPLFRPEFVCAGQHMVKGKGMMHTYYLRAGAWEAAVCRDTGGSQEEESGDTPLQQLDV